MQTLEAPWYADYVNYLACGITPPELTFQQKKKFLADVKHFYWDEPYLFRLCVDGIHRRCVPKEETHSILFHCHSSPYGGHASFQKKATRVLQAGFYWPTYPIAKEGFPRAGQVPKSTKDVIVELDEGMETSGFYRWIEKVTTCFLYRLRPLRMDFRFKNPYYTTKSPSLVDYR